MVASKEQKRKIIEKMEGNPKNISFSELCRAAEVFGFKYRGGRGSHRIFVTEGIPEMLNFQDVKGKAKPYQVKQFIKIIKKYKMEP